jgi:hypothetical protein
MDVIVVSKINRLVINKVVNERVNKWLDEDSLFLIAHVLPGKAKCVGVGNSYSLLPAQTGNFLGSNQVSQTGLTQHEGED